MTQIEYLIHKFNGRFKIEENDSNRSELFQKQPVAWDGFRCTQQRNNSGPFLKFAQQARKLKINSITGL